MGKKHGRTGFKKIVNHYKHSFMDKFSEKIYKKRLVELGKKYAVTIPLAFLHTL